MDQFQESSGFYKADAMSSELVPFEVPTQATLTPDKKSSMGAASPLSSSESLDDLNPYSPLPDQWPMASSSVSISGSLSTPMGGFGQTSTVKLLMGWLSMMGLGLQTGFGSSAEMNTQNPLPSLLEEDWYDSGMDDMYYELGLVELYSPTSVNEWTSPELAKTASETTIIERSDGLFLPPLPASRPLEPIMRLVGMACQRCGLSACPVCGMVGCPGCASDAFSGCSNCGQAGCLGCDDPQALRGCSVCDQPDCMGCPLSACTTCGQPGCAGCGPMTTVCQVHPILKGISDQPVSLQIPELSRYETGLYNAITDVKGIQVGHVTLIKEGPSPIQTGVTAILPDYPLLTRGEGNSATYGLPAFGDTISGYGEMTGLYAVRTLGVMNSPVILTNTRAVGRAFTGVGQYYRKHFPGLWRGGLPIVGECWDGRFNTINDLSVTEQDVVRALESAQGGPVAQGRIGAGRGMRSFGLHGGMGSASRVFEVGNKTYTLGVLVNSNHGDLDKMPAHIREALSDQIGSAQGWAERAQAESLAPVGQEDGGSIMIIIATDLPLSADQLALLIPRATAGLCVLGSKLSITSGDFVLAFSTARPVPLEKGAPLVQLQTRLNWDELNTVFEATVEAVAEAQLNALVASYAGF